MDPGQAIFGMFEAGRMAHATFDQREHVRVACALLRNRPFLEACSAMRDGFRRLARAAARRGVDHETITSAAIGDLLDRLRQLPAERAVVALPAAYPESPDRSMPSARYSFALLASERARGRFVRPDRAPVALDRCSLR